MAKNIKSVDDYLASLSADKRATLQKIRKAIRAAAPQAEERISYRIPMYFQNGMLIGFGAATNHCSFYLLNSATAAAFRRELKKYKTSAGTIRFPIDKPLPAALVRKLVKARLAENEARRESTTQNR